MSGDTMRGLFFIIKGRHVNKLLPAYTNRVSGEVGYIGGYDPEGENTDEWYMLMDRNTYMCLCCGSSLERVLRGVESQVLKYKGSAESYFKHLSEVTSDDYYDTHYLGRPPLTPEERAKKAEGRCPRTSPIMRCLYEEVERVYGDYYTDEIEDVIEKAYIELRDRKPINRSRKVVQRLRKTLSNTLKTTTEEPPKKVVQKKKDSTPRVIRPVKRTVKLLRV